MDYHCLLLIFYNHILLFLYLVSSDSSRKFQRSTEVMNVPVVQSTILPGDILAAKIRTYLSVCLYIFYFERS